MEDEETEQAMKAADDSDCAKTQHEDVEMP